MSEAPKLNKVTHGKGWTRAQIIELIQVMTNPDNQGLTFEVIGAMLGRSRNSVGGKWHRLQKECPQMVEDYRVSEAPPPEPEPDPEPAPAPVRTFPIPEFKIIETGLTGCPGIEIGQWCGKTKQPGRSLCAECHTKMIRQTHPRERENEATSLCEPYGYNY